jgi:hypothetical protein
MADTKPAVIPVAFEDVLKYVNLSDLVKNQRVIDLFGAHEGEIEVWLEKYTVDTDYTAVTADGGDSDTIRAAAFSAGYCLHSLAVALPFLNINTAGKGLIKTTGIDANATELLSGSEINKLQDQFNYQALDNLRVYLNDDGKSLLESYRPRARRGFRATVINGIGNSE